MLASIQGGSSIMSKHNQRRRQTESQSEVQENVYPTQVKKMTEQEIKDYHREKLYELSLKSLKQKPQLEEPTDDQKEWVLLRLSHPETWPDLQENKIGDEKNWS
jgi:hypothetical protein